MVCASIELQIQALEQSLSEGFEEQRERFMAELQSILDRKRNIMKKRLECVQSALRSMVCKKTLSSIFDARQYQLQDLKTDFSKQEEEYEKLIKRKEAIRQEIKETKQKRDELRHFLYRQSGLFHCGNNPDPNDFTCKCNTKKCEKLDKTALFSKIIENNFEQNIDACYV